MKPEIEHNSDSTPIQCDMFMRGFNLNDAVYTPDWCAKDMVEFFRPSGRILEPAKGDGAILRHLPKDAEWCEIQEGIDFFEWTNQVDWIISNPPYSTLRQWLMHSFNVASNIVYLFPLKNFFSAYGQIIEVRERGWVKHIRIYGTGSRLGFPMGNAVGAFYFVRDWHGDTSWSFYA